MTKAIRTVVCLLLLVASTKVLSDEFTRTDFSRVNFGAVSANRPGFPTTQDVFRVYVFPQPWGMSSCRQDAFDIDTSDERLIQLVLGLGRNGVGPLKLVIVDDSLPMVGGVCKAVFVRVGF